MNSNSHGDIVANTLEYYRNRLKNNDSRTPEPYQRIQKRLQKVADEGKKVLIDIKDSYSVHTVIVKFEYVHDRWAMGKSIAYLEGEEVEVPYTIHYSDILCKLMNIKVITEGDKPSFLKEGSNN